MKHIAEQFGLTDIVSVEELKSGHINKTYLVANGGGKYILQSLNRLIFPEPDIVMTNISLIAKAFEREHDIAVPRCLEGNSGNYAEYNGEIWRAYKYIENSGKYSHYVHGYASGRFINVVNSADIEFGNPLAELHDFYLPDVPKRNIHGDTKADNIIFGEKPAVIDLDTAMRGYICADYGDMIRSVTTKELDPTEIREATKGFADGVGGILTDSEKRSLYSGIILIIDELKDRYGAGEKNFPNKTAQQCHERWEQLNRQLDDIRRHEDEIINIINECFA